MSLTRHLRVAVIVAVSCGLMLSQALEKHSPPRAATPACTRA